MDNIDIYRSANLLIQQRGPGTTVEAAKRQVEMLLRRVNTIIAVETEVWARARIVRTPSGARVQVA